MGSIIEKIVIKQGFERNLLNYLLILSSLGKYDWIKDVDAEKGFYTNGSFSNFQFGRKFYRIPLSLERSTSNGKF